MIQRRGDDQDARLAQRLAEEAEHAQPPHIAHDVARRTPRSRPSTASHSRLNASSSSAICHIPTTFQPYGMLYPTGPHFVPRDAGARYSDDHLPSLSQEHKRRTQAERRAATHTALLDAAIDCLVEYGYAKTTTRRIAERAGVTPGALQHHFASKAALLGELIGYIRAKSMGEMLAEEYRAPARSESVKNSCSTACGVSPGSCRTALIELGIGARTDPEPTASTSPGRMTKPNWAV